MEQQEHAGCLDWLEPNYWGVHELMTRLLGRCTCESSPDRVAELYSVDGTRGDERVSA